MAVSADEIYLLSGLGLALLVALSAGFGLSLRSLGLALLLAVLVVVLIPIAVRISPNSIGFPLTLGAVICGAFLTALRLGWRGWPRLRGYVLFWLGLLLLNLAAGLIGPAFTSAPGSRADLGFQLGVQVIGLPLLAGLLLGIALAIRGEAG
ncbi:hypothetical protein [Paracoccus sediminicola]|uniref:hypothetical protein n=1 Tax=Paracoccus sediminicola TaxID=3017783 RepID=UPI0022F05CA6|nr:hypothetical protein [Paracoccus sediminicola]WBU55647.1 hypothetical protein PAF18_08910 [Paracoccus sediminicola]